MTGAAEFSTFRHTLAAIPVPVLGMTCEDDPQMSAWISARLWENAASVSDPDQLARVEAAVLDRLDPPLNPQARQPSPVRARITDLRRQRPATASARAGESV